MNAIDVKNVWFTKMQNKFKMKKDEIVDVLKMSGYQSWDINKQEEYEGALLRHKVRSALIRPEVKSIEEHCPLCGGLKFYTRERWWRCGAGGIRHGIVMQVAGTIVGREASFEQVMAKAREILAKVEVIHEEKEKGTSLEEITDCLTTLQEPIAEAVPA